MTNAIGSSSTLTNPALQVTNLITANNETIATTGAPAAIGGSLGTLPGQTAFPPGAATAGTSLPPFAPPFVPPFGPVAPGLPPGTFLPCGTTTCTGVWTFRANGEVIVRCLSPLIQASSRVTVTASEYSGVWTNRFIGLADVEVLNVSPFAGGMDIKVLIHWGTPLEIAISAVISF